MAIYESKLRRMNVYFIVILNVLAGDENDHRNSFRIRATISDMFL